MVESIAQLIESGELKEGDPLPPEREIVNTYGVSRTVVREAVVVLAARGLVEARPRHRPVIRKPGFDTAFETVSDIVGRLLVDPAGVRNLFETRVMTEVSMVRQAAVDANKDDIAALKSALSENEAALSDSALFYQTDIAFHKVLYAVPRNPLLISIHDAFVTWLEVHWNRMPPMVERNESNFAAHKAIFDAILLRDADRAEKEMRAHMAFSWSQVSQVLSKQ